MRIDHDNVINTWLLEAKKLHKSAQSVSLTRVLPVLRRLLNSKVLVDISLPELKIKTDMIQRKHLLQMLAIEKGYNSWAELKRAIVVKSQADELLLPYSLELKNAGYPTLWFATVQEAQCYAEKHSGKVVVGGGASGMVAGKGRCRINFNSTERCCFYCIEVLYRVLGRTKAGIRTINDGT